MHALSSQVREIWNHNAAFWDERMGEGNDFHKLLIEPTQERLLALQPGELVLDIACGNGQFARHLAEKGARVVAFDFSEKLIAHARARTTGHADRVQYHVIDAADREQLLALAPRRFDAAVCTMAFMDMADLEALLTTLPQLLKNDGRFVFSLCHPCFNSGEFMLVAEEEDREGNIVTTHAVKISRYMHASVKKGLAIRGQPVPHLYFHRPLSMILDVCFRAGFVLDAFEEPVLGERARPEKFWEGVYRDIPPAWVARLRLLR